MHTIIFMQSYIQIIKLIRVLRIRRRWIRTCGVWSVEKWTTPMNVQWRMKKENWWRNERDTGRWREERQWWRVVSGLWISGTDWRMEKKKRTNNVCFEIMVCFFIFCLLLFSSFHLLCFEFLIIKLIKQI